MKKLFFSIVLLMAFGGFSAFSQIEADFSLITRAEYSSSVNDGPFGNSSIYALCDASLGENLSFYGQLHLLNSTPGDLYAGTLYSNSTSWLDIASLYLTLGDFEISAGKDALCIGTFEMQGDDFDQFYEMSSTLWYNLPAYQLGVKASWYPSDTFTLSAQATASPEGERPFASGLYTFNLMCGTQKENYADYYSLNLIQRQTGGNAYLFSMGTTFRFLKRFSFLWDTYVILNQVTFDGISNPIKWILTLPGNNTFILGCDLQDNLRLEAKAGFEECFGGFDSIAPQELRTYYGLSANYKPIESLRLHAMAGYDNMIGKMVNAGLTYYFEF